MTDLHRALAEGMHADGYCGDAWPSDHEPYHLEDAAAILATEPMQDIARLAAIGAAVEQALCKPYHVLTIERVDDADGPLFKAFHMPLTQGKPSRHRQVIAAIEEALR